MIISRIEAVLIAVRSFQDKLINKTVYPNLIAKKDAVNGSFL